MKINMKIYKFSSHEVRLDDQHPSYAVKLVFQYFKLLDTSIAIIVYAISQ